MLPCGCVLIALPAVATGRKSADQDWQLLHVLLCSAVGRIIRISLY